MHRHRLHFFRLLFLIGFEDKAEAIAEINQGENNIEYLEIF
jgi:hypothetical protein